MPKPTQQQLDQWWNGLQRTLNEANADIDLNNPRDLIRFRVTEIKNKEEYTVIADVSAYFPFADDKNIDLLHTTDEQLVAAQRPGKPDTKKLTELYTAAREGRLFFNSLSERDMKPRQVLVNKNGDAEVGQLIDAESREMDLAAKTLEPPRKPKMKSAGIGNRIAAFFGSKEAKQRCAEVDRQNERLMQDYRRKKALVEEGSRLDPLFLMQTRNLVLSTANYFENFNDEDKVCREINLVTEFNKQHKQPLVDAVVDMTKQKETQAINEISDLMKNSSEVTPKARELIAEFCYQRMLGQHVARQFNEDNLTEDDITRAAHEAVAGSREYKANFAKTCGSENFTRAIERLSAEDVKAFAADPEAAADAVYVKCTKGALQVVMDRSKAAMKDVQVKQQSKEFTATQKRPQLETAELQKQSHEAQPRL